MFAYDTSQRCTGSDMLSWCTGGMETCYAAEYSVPIAVKLGRCSQMSRHVKSGNTCERTLQYVGVEKQIAKKVIFHHLHSSLFFFLSQFN